MKKIARFRFFDEEDTVLADYQPPPNDLQVVSCGRRRITLPSIQESHHDRGRQTLSTGTILDDLVYNPTPLRWYRPPEADFNGDDRNEVDDVSRNPSDDLVGKLSNLDGCRVDEVKTTLRLSDYVSRNSEILRVKKCAINYPTPLRWYRPPEADFNGDDRNKVDDVSRNPSHDLVGKPSNLDGCRVDEVKTTLRLSDYVSRNSEIPPVKKCAINYPTPLRWYRPPEAYFNGDDRNKIDDDISRNPSHDDVKTPSNLDGFRVDEVKTTLRLSDYVSRNSEIPPVKKCAINSTPLRWFQPNFFDGIEDDEVDTTLSLRPPGSTNPSKSRKQAKGKRRADDDVVEDRHEKRRSKRSKNEDDEDQRPLIPIEKIEGLFQAIQSRNGSRPVFLYRKKLEDSDVKRNLNRLFVTRRERMMGFLREEEAAAVDGGGLEIDVGVDGGGKVYENLGLKKWESLKMTVINKNWGKVVDANDAKKGDVVEIWGFRVMNEKPCLAFNFRRENGGDNAASSSGTTCSDEGSSQV